MAMRDDVAINVPYIAQNFLYFVHGNESQEIDWKFNRYFLASLGLNILDCPK